MINLSRSFLIVLGFVALIVVMLLGFSIGMVVTQSKAIATIEALSTQVSNAEKTVTSLAASCAATQTAEATKLEINNLQIHTVNQPCTIDDPYGFYTSFTYNYFSSVGLNLADQSTTFEYEVRLIGNDGRITFDDKSSQLSGNAFNGSVIEVMCVRMCGENRYCIPEGQMKVSVTLRDAKGNQAVAEKVQALYPPTD